MKIVQNGPLNQGLIKKIKTLGERDSVILLNYLARIGRVNQWPPETINAALHITEAYPSIGERLANVLGEIPAQSLKPAVVTLIKGKEWAKALLEKWESNPDISAPVKNIIKKKNKGE